MKRRPKRWRGAGLATVIMLTALLFTLAFTVVGMAFNHLSLTTRAGNSQQAKNLAEAAISRGIEQILVNGSFGKAGGSASTVNVSFPHAPEGAYGILTFDQGVADSLGIKKSTNNFDSDTAVNGTGCKVPAFAVHFAAKGFCNGAEKHLDAVLYIPRFPWAIASSGPVESGGGLMLAGLRNGGDPNNVTDYLPAHLDTNSGIGANAIRFAGNNVTILGDAQSSSGANFGNATVKGERRLYAAPVTLPTLDIASYDTKFKAGVVNISSNPSSNTLSGYARGDGPVYYGNGLKLNGAVLFVNGDLTVDGPVSGTGAVIVNGTTTFKGGGGNLVGDSTVAVLSKKNLSIAGNPGDRTSVKGIIYSEQRIDATEANIQGPMISNDRGAGGSVVNATNVNALSQDSMTNISFAVSSPGSNSSVDSSNQVLGTQGVISNGPNSMNLTTTAVDGGGVTPANVFNSPIQSGFQWSGSMKLSDGTVVPGPGNIDVNVSVAVNPTTPASRFTVANSTAAPMAMAAPFPSLGNSSVFFPPGTYIVNASTQEYSNYTGSVAPLSQNDFVVRVGSAAPVKMSTGSWISPAVNLAYSSLDNYAMTQYGRHLDPSNQPVMTSGWTSQLTGSGKNALWTASITASYAVYKASNGGVQSLTFGTAANGTGTTTDIFTINLNNNTTGLPTAEQVRILYWKES